MRKIIVEIGRLEASANSIESLNAEYQRLYNELYDAVDVLQGSWKGKDNIAFTNQIKEFNNDFRQISSIMTQYTEFLRNTARAYRETQDEIYNQAQQLIN